MKRYAFGFGIILALSSNACRASDRAVAQWDIVGKSLAIREVVVTLTPMAMGMGGGPAINWPNAVTNLNRFFSFVSRFEQKQVSVLVNGAEQFSIDCTLCEPQNELYILFIEKVFCIKYGHSVRSVAVKVAGSSLVIPREEFWCAPDLFRLKYLTSDYFGG